MEPKIHTADDGKQRCSSCGKCIPKDVERISFHYQSRHSYDSYKRLCGICITKAYNALNKKPIEKWGQKLAIEAL